MAFVIEIELLTGRYDASGADDRDRPEWPPHPARVFCALVASATDTEDRDALRWLERLPAPVVQAANATNEVKRRGYVVTNQLETKNKGASQFHPGRTNALQVRPSTLPSAQRVRLVWPDALPASDVAARLDRLARRVPYVGRSTGSATVCCRVVDEAQARLTPPGLTSYQPGGGPSTQLLRVPFPGYLDELDRQFEADPRRPAWEVSRTIPYRSADAADGVASEPEITPSAYRDFIVLRFQGLRPDGQLAPMFTAALRRAVMAATEDPLPAVLHGHGADRRPHVAFLALPNVGNEFADGRLLGMAVAVPYLGRDHDDERRAIVRGVLLGMRSGAEPAHDGRRTLELQVPHIGAVSLVEDPGLVRPWGLRPERWRQGSNRWASVTPVVLDRYPKRGDIEGEIVRSCVELGFPEPEEIVVSTAPLVTGGIHLRPRELPDKLRGRLFRHVQLDFGRRVSGPVLLGAGRYLGIGLMTPLPAKDV